MLETSPNFDGLIRASLTSFFDQVISGEWLGREREAVSLFTFGHLLPLVEKGTPLHDARQIGIEVAVPQHKVTLRKKTPEVCKDVVIWPNADMTAWGASGAEQNYPLAILEWKMIKPRRFSSERPKERREEFLEDILWLVETSRCASDFTGYGILLDLRSKSPTLLCERVARGNTEADWLVLNAGQASDLNI